MPMRVGVYHGFRQAVEQDARQHTLYVVVTGCENYAADEVFNLWQDSGEHMTAQQFAETGPLVNGAETHHAIVYTDVSHHRGRFMYPDEAFLMSLQKLGSFVKNLFLAHHELNHVGQNHPFHPIGLPWAMQCAISEQVKRNGSEGKEGWERSHRSTHPTTFRRLRVQV